MLRVTLEGLQLLNTWTLSRLIQPGAGDQITVCHRYGTVGSPAAESGAVYSRQRLAILCMFLNVCRQANMSPYCQGQLHISQLQERVIS
jgi:hypothetical protein